MKFEPNPNFERELAKVAAPAMTELARKRTEQYDALIAQHDGGDVELVKSKLERIHEADGGHISDPELSQHCDLAEGTDNIAYPCDGCKGAPTRRGS